MQNGKAMSHGIARNVLPANIQQPIVAIRQGDQSRLLPGRAQIRRQALPLGLMALPGKTLWMCRHFAHR